MLYSFLSLESTLSHPLAPCCRAPRPLHSTIAKRPMTRWTLRPYEGSRPLGLGWHDEFDTHTLQQFDRRHRHYASHLPVIAGRASGEDG